MAPPGCPLSTPKIKVGHEDVDQLIGQSAGYIATIEYDGADQLVEHLDSTARVPGSAGSRPHALANRSAAAYKLDECADWRSWVLRLGIRMKGLRFLVFKFLLSLLLCFAFY